MPSTLRWATPSARAPCCRCCARCAHVAPARNHQHRCSAFAQSSVNRQRHTVPRSTGHRIGKGRLAAPGARTCIGLSSVQARPYVQQLRGLFCLATDLCGGCWPTTARRQPNGSRTPEGGLTKPALCLLHPTDKQARLSTRSCRGCGRTRSTSASASWATPTLASPPSSTRCAPRRWACRL